MNSNLCTSNPARTSVMLWKYMTNKQMHAKKTLKNWVVIKCSIQNALAWPHNIALLPWEICVMCSKLEYASIDITQTMYYMVDGIP